MHSDLNMHTPERLNPGFAIAGRAAELSAERMEEAKRRLIVALEAPVPADALGLVDRLENRCQWELAGPKAVIVVPGIRSAGASVGDEKRIATPPEAMTAGASYLVVGRPITQAADPGEAAEAVLRQIAGALELDPQEPKSPA